MQTASRNGKPIARWGRKAKDLPSRWEAAWLPEEQPMGSQNTRDRHPSRLPELQRSRCAEVSELQGRGGRSRVRSGTRILDASSTLYLEPPSATEVLEPEQSDDRELDHTPLPRRGAGRAPQRVAPAPALELQPRAAVPPRPTAPVGLEDSRDPRASLRACATG